MACPHAEHFLRPDAHRELLRACDDYPAHYDDVLDDVHERLHSNGHASKLDLAALIGWKHVNNAKWMQTMLLLPPDTVEAATAAAFEPGLTDGERIAALASIPGYGRGGAFTSVLLTAWDPAQFGVYDRRAASTGWSRAVTDACSCPRHHLPIWFEHLRQLAEELSALEGMVAWTARSVDMALFNL